MRAGSRSRCSRPESKYEVVELSEFLDMSGYGAYVWSAYALALVVLVSNVWAARRRLREEIVRTRRRLQTREEQQS